METSRHSFAYLFERFPSFVQTFVYREAVEMVRQGMNPWLVSIRHPDDPVDLAEHLDGGHLIPSAARREDCPDRPHRAWVGDLVERLLGPRPLRGVLVLQVIAQLR